MRLAMRCAIAAYLARRIVFAHNFFFPPPPSPHENAIDDGTQKFDMMLVN
jgi:hypothetical protein